jgi:hypothetical protein
MSVENTQNKIVNVHGIRFDISSILNDVTASIQNNIQKSLDGALKDYELYKSTHDAILQIPFVRDLYIQNQELISQIDQPIQLKIDEILPHSSPVVMHSYVPLFESNHNEPNKKNKKLSDELSRTAVQNEILTESESSEEYVTSIISEAETESDESNQIDDEQEEASAEEDASAAEEDASAEEEDEASAEEEEEEASAAEEEASAAEEEASAAEEEASAAEEEEEEESAEEASAEEEDEEEASVAEEEEEASAEEEEEEEASVAEEAEEEVYEIVIKNITYFTTNEDSGDIYSCVDGDVGEIVGKFKNKKPVFTRRK